jgi:hypothetical protein
VAYLSDAYNPANNMAYASPLAAHSTIARYDALAYLPVSQIEPNKSTHYGREALYLPKLQAP